MSTSSTYECLDSGRHRKLERFGALVIVEGTGHWLFVDGTEEFDACIRGFLARVP